MQILINGHPQQVNSEATLFRVKQDFYGETDTIILNGFQTTLNVNLEENDELVFIKKREFPSLDVLESMMMARHTPKVHGQAKQAKIGIAGLGGLGSNIAIILARTGIGHLLLVDFDIVEPSNLNRQNYNISHLGKPKAEALKEQIIQINPFIKVEALIEKVNENNLKNIFEGCHIVCESFDDPEAKAMLVSGVLFEMPNTKVVSGSGMAGYDSSNTIKTVRKMQNLYVCGDGETEARIGRGLMAPRVNICAGHQANMILRLILDINDVD